MKKFVSVLLVLSLLAWCLPASIAQTTATDGSLLVLQVGSKSYLKNGAHLTMDVEPEIVKGRTFVPIRFVSEALGAGVNWNETTKTVTITSGLTVIVLKIGSVEATVRDKKLVLEAAPYIKAGRTMTPIRLVSEGLGMFVHWGSQARQVFIREKPSVSVPGVSADEIKIGSFIALTGFLAFVGVPFYQGMQSYFNMVNDAGGVYGKKIKLIVEDDRFDPARTVTGVKKLVEEDKVLAIVGGLGTPGCLAVMDYLNKGKVPFVYQGSGVSILSVPPQRYVFSVQPNYFNEGQIFVQHIVNNMKLKRIAVMYQDDDAGREGLFGVRTGIKRFGGSISLEIPFPGTETDFTPYLLRVKASGADALIVYSLSVGVGATVVKATKSLGITQSVFLPYPHSGIIGAAGDAAENVYVTGWVDFSDPQEPGVKKFWDIWLKYFPKGDPLSFSYAVAGYAAGEVFVEALMRLGPNPSREALVWALESYRNWNGDLVKDLSYGTKERSGKYSMFFMQVINKELKKVSGWVSVL